MSLPSQLAVGKPVTLNLHDGHILHGILHAGTNGTFYVLACGGQTVRIRRNLVYSLVVRERVS